LQTLNTKVKMQTINCNGKKINTSIPIVMGIINATPDSFYKSDLQSGLEGIINLAEKMIADGATILDIGGQSTKPNSEIVSTQAEIDRVIPVIEILHKHFPNIILSVDTFNSKVAKAAVAAGASMVNDVSAGNLDTGMIKTVGQLKNIPYVCMHMRGTPATMQMQTTYHNLIEELIVYFNEKITLCNDAGITDVIIDPGFGFAKTIEQNFLLLKQLSALYLLNKPILMGVSRKSSIYKTLGITANEALNGTTVLNTIALLNGANILRVHDVKEAIEVIKLLEVYKKNNHII
jgi:dihydropteroate synthase